MEEWKECKLGEIATITKLAGFEFTKYIKYNETGEIIALRALNLRNGRLDLTEVKHIDKSVSDALPRSKLYKGEILFTYTGNGYGDCALVDEDDKYHLAPNICKISPNKKIADSNFLFQTIRSNAFYKQVSNYIGGSSQPTIPMETIRQLKVKLPPLPTQQKIAAILSFLDDKIELNNKINTNLEQQAQALFKNWFVDFEPFGGKMPDGWKVGKLGELVETTVNGDWGKDEPAGTTTEFVYCIRGADIPNVKIGNKGKMPKRYILPKNFEAKHLVNGDLVIEVSGGSPTQSTGRIAYISQALLHRYEEKIVCTNFCKAIKPKQGYQMFMYYYWQYLYEKDVFFSYENGTTGIKNLDITGILENEEIAIPSKVVLSDFNNFCNSVFSEIFSNSAQSEQLSNLRDSLLPKLMNGEIEVDKVEL